MVEAVHVVTQIVEVALKIKDAVDTVRENKEDCLQIKRRVERIRHTLSLCENNAEMMEHSAVRAMLERLGENLGEALGLVADSQERSFVCHCCTAGKLSKQLRKVEQDISNLNSDATLAILAYQMWKQNQDGAHPPPAPAPAQMMDERHSYGPESPPEAPSYSMILQAMTLDQQYSYGPESPPPEAPRPRPRPRGELTLHGMSSRRPPRLPLGGVIGQVALEITEAVQAVQQNKEECIQIDKRANIISALLSMFESTETMKDPAMSAQLEKLLGTLRHARTLVTACQRRNINIIWPAGKLSKQLGEVLDEMVLAFHDMIAISAGRAPTV